ncbi:hypothetical protein [Chitinimonas sp.]|uniref:hypothetical protein n=1 Tax=Chitinimonas sp. TaxID=1934313 RepID=UPI0035AEF0A0
MSIELLWISDNPEWEDVRCPADKAVREGERLTIIYSGATDEGGHYEGAFEFSLGDGMQSLEGEYTVYPPKGSPEPFTQVVGFGLTGSIRPLPGGGVGFVGIWDEGGIAQAFSVGPLPMADAAADEDDRAYQVDSLPDSALPAIWRLQALALRDFHTALWPFRHIVADSPALAPFAAHIANLDALLDGARQQFDQALAGTLDGDELLDWLRDEASLALEQMLDQLPAVIIGPAEQAAAPALAATLHGIGERLHSGIQMEGYQLCKVWLGLE